MDITEQELNYMLNVLSQRPLGEALPLFLKLTNQKVVPNTEAKEIPISALRGGRPGSD